GRDSLFGDRFAGHASSDGADGDADDSADWSCDCGSDRAPRSSRRSRARRRPAGVLPLVAERILARLLDVLAFHDASSTDIGSALAERKENAGRHLADPLASVRLPAGTSMPTVPLMRL